MSSTPLLLTNILITSRGIRKFEYLADRQQHFPLDTCSTAADIRAVSKYLDEPGEDIEELSPRYRAP
jgi:hypothetical protein